MSKKYLKIVMIIVLAIVLVRQIEVYTNLQWQENQYNEIIAENGSLIGVDRLQKKVMSTVFENVLKKVQH